MLGTTVLAIAAVLTRDAVVFAETTSGRVVRQVPLPAAAVAIFAAPDGKVLLPLQGSDETVVVSPAGPSRRWPGRLFPVFFDEIDRMQLVFPELLLVASYPERLPILRVPVPGMTAPWRTVASSNGLLVAICAVPRERRLIIAVSEPGATQREMALDGEPRAVAIAPHGEWVGVGLAGAVQAVFAGDESARRPVAVAGTVEAVASTSDGGEALVGTSDGTGGALVTVGMNAKSDPGAKVHGSLRLPGPVTSIAVVDKEVMAVSGDSLAVIGKNGRKLLRQIAIPGARQVVVLPADPTTAVPLWSESPPS